MTKRKPVKPIKARYLQVRVSQSELESFQAAADLGGAALSAWVRERLRRACIREMEEAGKVPAFLLERTRE